MLLFIFYIFQAIINRKLIFWQQQITFNSRWDVKLWYRVNKTKVIQTLSTGFTRKMNIAKKFSYIFKIRTESNTISSSDPEWRCRAMVPWSSIISQRIIKAFTGVNIIVYTTVVGINRPQSSAWRKVRTIMIVCSLKTEYIRHPTALYTFAKVHVLFKQTIFFYFQKVWKKLVNHSTLLQAAILLMHVRVNWLT